MIIGMPKNVIRPEHENQPANTRCYLGVLPEPWRTIVHGTGGNIAPGERTRQLSGLAIELLEGWQLSVLNQQPPAFALKDARLERRTFGGCQDIYCPVCRAEPLFRQAAGGSPTWRLKARLKAYSDS
jgi:hypothetical protein